MEKALVYLVYLVSAASLIVYLARVLSQNGAVFLQDVFATGEMARAVNKLLVVGFYLFNLGFALLNMRFWAEVTTMTQSLEFFAGKFGELLMLLAVMHFGNLFVFQRIRASKRKADERSERNRRILAPEVMQGAPA